MSFNAKIEEAIRAAVEEKGQSTALSDYLTAWMNSVTSGNEDINDKQAAYRHLELIYSETVVHEIEESWT